MHYNTNIHMIRADCPGPQNYLPRAPKSLVAALPLTFVYRIILISFSSVTLQQADHATAWQNFKASAFDSVLDTIDVELEQRFQAYTQLSTRFGFLRKIHALTPE